jgi:anti-sigma B factor antagonist
VTPLARLELEGEGAIVVARVRGDVDLSNAADLRRALEAAATPDRDAVIVDLAEVGYLDSSGVSVLVGLARGMAVRKQRMAVVAPPGGSARRVLDLVGFDNLATVCESTDQAVAALHDAP